MSENKGPMDVRAMLSTGGDPGKMAVIMAGTVLALFLMLGIGYYFSGIGGGGDEASITEVSEEFMRLLIKGDISSAEKYCAKDVLKDVGDEYTGAAYEIKDVHGAPRSASVDITVSSLKGRKDIRLTFVLDDGDWLIRSLGQLDEEQDDQPLK